MIRQNILMTGSYSPHPSAKTGKIRNRGTRVSRLRPRGVQRTRITILKMSRAATALQQRFPQATEHQATRHRIPVKEPATSRSDFTKSLSFTPKRPLLLLVLLQGK